MLWIVTVAAAFLLGSLPWGLWFGRGLKGIDVRAYGSGNLGATNVYRVLGPVAGIAVLLLDAAKGAGAVLVARVLLGGSQGSGPGEWAGLVALVAAVLGHSYTPFAGFRGGKGVATAAGAWAVLAPLPLALAFGLWALIFAATRIVSLASLAAALALPIATGLVRPRPVADPAFWAAVVTALLLLLRHRANIGRLLRGREGSLRLRGPSSPQGSGRPGGESGAPGASVQRGRDDA